MYPTQQNWNDVVDGQCGMALNYIQQRISQNLEAQRGMRLCTEEFKKRGISA